MYCAKKFKKLSKNNNSFVDWFGNVRNCFECKFFQIEFVDVFMKLFRNFRMKPVSEIEENDVMGRARLLKQIQVDSEMRLLLQILHPKRAILQWTRH